MAGTDVQIPVRTSSALMRDPRTHPPVLVPRVSNIHFEPSGKCQLTCIGCPREKNYVSCVPFEFFVDDWARCRPMIRSRDTLVTFTGFTEWALDPDRWRKIDYVINEGCRFNFHSNCIGLTHDDVERLAALDARAIGLDEPRRSTNRWITDEVDDPIVLGIKVSEPNEQRAVDNCIRLMAALDARGDERLKAKFRIETLYGRNLQLHAACERYGFTPPSGQAQHTFGGTAQVNHVDPPPMACDRADPISNTVKVFVTGGPKRPVSVCCFDYRARHIPIGNLAEETLAEILAADRFQAFWRDTRWGSQWRRPLCRSCNRCPDAQELNGGLKLDSYLARASLPS